MLGLVHSASRQGGQAPRLFYPSLPPSAAGGFVPSGMFRHDDEMATVASDNALAPEQPKSEALGWV